MKRTQTRELAFQLIYSMEVQKEMQQEQLTLFIEENAIEGKQEINYMKEIFGGISTDISSGISSIKNLSN